MALAISLVCAGLWGPMIMFGAWLVALVVNRSVMNSIGGLTGDTYGALCEVEEVCVLLMVFVLRGTGHPWWT
jgi:adenosylcobinamide-GDP ribazoletransferase